MHRDPITRGGRQTSTRKFLRDIGVRDISPHTSSFDPGFDPLAVESYLEQSAHLMSSLKISMACWLVADEACTRRKFEAARRHGVPAVTGGGPFEIAVAQGHLEDYLDLCADVGASLIECGQGFTDMPLSPREVISMARERRLDVQFEVGKKHGGAFASDTVDELIAQGLSWLDAGARQIVVEGRESAKSVGIYGDDGEMNLEFADRFVEAYGLPRVVFEAPTKASQFTLLSHFGGEVELCNVRLEEVLRVEIFRRGLHSDAFGIEKLRPARPGRKDPERRE